MLHVKNEESEGLVCVRFVVTEVLKVSVRIQYSICLAYPCRHGNFTRYY